jgi:hypothetical protein
MLVFWQKDRKLVVLTVRGYPDVSSQPFVQRGQEVHVVSLQEHDRFAHILLEPGGYYLGGPALARFVRAPVHVDLGFLMRSGERAHNGVLEPAGRTWWVALDSMSGRRRA